MPVCCSTWPRICSTSTPPNAPSWPNCSSARSSEPPTSARPDREPRVAGQRAEHRAGPPLPPARAHAERRGLDAQRVLLGVERDARSSRRDLPEQRPRRRALRPERADAAPTCAGTRSRRRRPRPGRAPACSASASASASPSAASIAALHRALGARSRRVVDDRDRLVVRGVDLVLDVAVRRSARGPRRSRARQAASSTSCALSASSSAATNRAVGVRAASAMRRSR